MKTIEIKMCLGTTCFVMGSSNLQSLAEIVKERYGDRVKVVRSSCLGICSTDWASSRAPYVKVNDEIVVEATVEKILDEVERQLA